MYNVFDYLTGNKLIYLINGALYTNDYVIVEIDEENEQQWAVSLTSVWEVDKNLSFESEPFIDSFKPSIVKFALQYYKDKGVLDTSIDIHNIYLVTSSHYGNSV